MHEETNIILPKEVYKKNWGEDKSRPLDFKHFEILQSSGLSKEAIENAGYYSSKDGWAIDFTNPYTGEVKLTITRLDNPSESGPKYLQPKDTKPFAYFSKQIDWTKILDDYKQSLIITEGCKKADVAIQHGFPTVSLQGTYGWSHKKKLIDSMKWVLVPGRTIYICYDSDLKENENVKKAVEKLALEAYRCKCKVFQINLPRSTKGLDDFFNSVKEDENENK